MDTVNKLVWLPDQESGFAIGKIVDILADKVSVQLLARPSSRNLTYDLVSNTFSSSTSTNNNNNALTQEFPYTSIYPFYHLTLKQLHTQSPNLMSKLDDYDDNCALLQLNEPSLLDNIRIRFLRNKIYSYIAHILIAVNPYVEIRGLHSNETIAAYKGKSLGTMPPHVYAIADKAYRDMKAFKQSQSIIISGESGAGKTESQKYVLRYLCLLGASHSKRLEQLILEANPLLEAFGNAKTIRNNNSSRFGKFIQLHYSSTFSVSGAIFMHYLLEKSRICSQALGERNYHIFYQLCASLPEQKWRQLSLAPPDTFRYLNTGCTQYFCSAKNGTDKGIPNSRKCVNQKNNNLIDPLVDDISCFEQTDKALSSFVNVSPELKDSIYSIVAAILHLGNIEFVETDSSAGCTLAPFESASKALKVASSLLGLDEVMLRESLVSRIMSTSRGGQMGTIYMVQLNVNQAQNARDALAKAIYTKLFDFIVTQIINKSISASFCSSSNDTSDTQATNNSMKTKKDIGCYFIGVLDVAGFEFFQRNSYEQLLINFCNEKLQAFFNERIMSQEQRIYEAEGLNVKKVHYIDNIDCIELFESKTNNGLFPILDDECRLPRPSAKNFTSTVHAMHSKHFRLAPPRASKLRAHRELRDDEGFLVRHFAGAVCYETGAFIEKNNDALHSSLRCLMQESSVDLIRQLFDAAPSGQLSYATTEDSSSLSLVSSSSSSASLSSPSPSPTYSSPKRSTKLPAQKSQAKQTKLNFVSVSATFRSQLAELMTKLESTGSHFIKCIKPNNEMIASKFDGSQILAQLHCSGMHSVLKLMQVGYPSRASFADLYAAYARLLPPSLAKLEPRLFCRSLFKALGLGESDFRFGATRVFFKAGKFAEFDELIRAERNEQSAKELVARVAKWMLGARWRKLQYATVAAIKLTRLIEARRKLVVQLQAHWRAYLVQRRIRHTLISLRTARKILLSLCEFDDICSAAASAFNSLPERRVLEDEARELRLELETFVNSHKQQVQGSLELSYVASSAAQKSASQAHLDKLATKRDLLIRSIKDKLSKQRAALAALEAQLADERRERQARELETQRAQQARAEHAQLEARRLKSEAEQQAEVAPSLQRAGRVDAATDPMSCGELSAALDAAQNRADQEMRDYAVAARLASELADPRLPAAPAPALAQLHAELHGGVAHAKHSAVGGAGVNNNKHDLSKWRYSELRDTINTSCDLELLEACKREFHRRLKVYHAWKAANSRHPANATDGGVDGGTLRAPASILAHATSTSLEPEVATTGGGREQRYFRIPFSSSSLVDISHGCTNESSRGWWFAHFDGQWIARQLEIHPGRRPILLIAGKDDMSMCELSLRETRLASRRGAEITNFEFEVEWQRAGGANYMNNTKPNSSSQRSLLSSNVR